VVVGLVLPQEIGDMTLRLREGVDARGRMRVVHRVVWSVMDHPLTHVPPMA
jgi:hypothetical protein